MERAKTGLETLHSRLSSLAYSLARITAAAPAPPFRPPSLTRKRKRKRGENASFPCHSLPVSQPDCLGRDQRPPLTVTHCSASTAPHYYHTCPAHLPPTNPVAGRLLQLADQTPALLRRPRETRDETSGLDRAEDVIREQKE